jgi:hypothetical protein
VPTSAQEVAALVAYVLPGFVFLKGAELFLPPRVSRGSDIAILSVLWSFPLAFAAALGLDRFAVVPSPEIVALTACSLGLLAAVAVGWLYTRRTFRLAIARFTNMSQPRIWIGLLDRQMYVQVQIDTNDVFYGYPAVISNDPAASWPDLYLRGAAAVAADETRDPLPNTEGIFIPGGRVRMIQFLLPGQVIPIGAGSEPRSTPPAASTS